MSLASDICRIVGHEYKKNAIAFICECIRCGHEITLEELLGSNLKGIADSMAAPLRSNLNYRGIGKKILKVDNLPQDDLPIYDKDLPDQEI